MQGAVEYRQKRSPFNNPRSLTCCGFCLCPQRKHEVWGRRGYGTLHKRQHWCTEVITSALSAVGCPVRTDEILCASAAQAAHGTAASLSCSYPLGAARTGASTGVSRLQMFPDYHTTTDVPAPFKVILHQPSPVIAAFAQNSLRFANLQALSAALHLEMMT